MENENGLNMNIMRSACLVMVLPRAKSPSRQLVPECSLEVEPLRVIQLLVHTPPTQVRLEGAIIQTSWNKQSLLGGALKEKFKR